MMALGAAGERDVQIHRSGPPMPRCLIVASVNYIIAASKHCEVSYGSDVVKFSCGGGEAVQPLLHETDRCSARGVAQQPVLADRSTFDVRDRPPEEFDCGRSVRRTRAGSGVRQPHPAIVRTTWIDQADKIRRRRETESSGAHSQGTEGFQAAGSEIEPASGRNDGKSAGGAAEATG